MLKINKMENAFGIKSLKVNCNNKNILHQALIYSNNGTFKTSFSRTLYYLSQDMNFEIMDRISKTPANINIELVDDCGNTISKDLNNKIIVFSSELYRSNDYSIINYAKELQFLTIDNESKDKVNELITNNVNKMKNMLIEKLKDKKINVDKTTSLFFEKTIDSVSINDLESFFTFISKVEVRDISKINLKSLFTKPYEAIDKDDFSKAATTYVQIFNKRLQEELFDADFNDSNCMSFLDSIKDSFYLSKSKKRGISIQDNTYYDEKEIEEIFNNAIKNVSNDPSVLSANRELIKTMGVSKEAKGLREQFKDDPILINQLSIGRRNIIAIALINEGLDANKNLQTIATIKEEYLKLIQESQNKRSQFEDAIELYKSRFNPIFDIIIENKKESILGLQVPLLLFIHKSNKEVKLEENDIKVILSSGEKTALNIISFIVNYEANKNSHPIIVLDDIVETFDYSNRYAFIEYIRDIVNDEQSIIVLTHNYEFYRTLRSRIQKLDQLCAYSKDGKVYIEQNSSINFDMEKVFDIQNDNRFLFSIPYLREIKMMINYNTEILDNCLHYKTKTKQLTISDIIDEYFQKEKIKINGNRKYIDVLYECADKFDINNRFDIVTKTIISIACRILLESKIINDNYSLIKEFDNYQLIKIKEKYGNSLSEEINNLIDIVQITTPEFIHGNVFMYEPLVDIDGQNLLSLYDRIKKIDIKKVWKE